MKETKVIIYNRVSTVIQEKKDSLSEQIDECIKYCKERNYNIVKIFKDVKSGTTDDREGYIELKKHIKRKDFDLLVVLETSRIARTMKELILFFSDLSEQGIDFVSVREPSYNTTTPDGKFAMTIRLGLIQFERDNIAERVTDRMYFKASKGQWLNGNPPIGYKLVDKKLIIDEEKAGIVKNIFNDFLNGLSLNKISEKNNFTWGSKRVKRILTNPTYKGFIRYGTRTNGVKNKRESLLVKGQHEAIISENDFDKTQELLKLIYRPERNVKITLLSGLLKCGKCGHNFTRKVGNNYNKNLYYGCSLNKLICSDKIYYRGFEKCNSGSIKGKILENAVIETLKKEIEKLDFNNIEVKKNVVKDTKSIENNINKIKKKLDKIYELYIEDEISKEKYLSDKEKLLSQLSMYENKKIETKEKKSLISNNEMIKEYFNKINFEDIENANRILKIIIKKIVVYKEKKIPRDDNDFEIEIYLNI